jgi:hypothetical protein
MELNKVSMEEKFGLILGFECRFVKSDPEIIEKISKRSGLDKTLIKSEMRYNIVIIEQFMDLSGLANSTIRNLIRPCVKNKETGAWDTKLDFCFPFRSSKKQGPLFIILNEKAECYLK